MKRDTDIGDAVKAFSGHVASLSAEGKFSVLTWARPGDSTYAMRAVFDREANTVTVSGDLYDCVFRPTCLCDLASVAKCFAYYDREGALQVNESYFIEKVSAGNNLYCYNSDDACEEITERWNEKYGEGDGGSDDTDEDGNTEYRDTRDRGDLDDLLSEVDSAMDHRRGICLTDGMKEAMEELDSDWWEWAYGLGRRFDFRVTWWLVGMRMAYDQLVERGADLQK